MATLFSSLFSTGFMPHGTCYLWQTNILLLHTVSDSMIAAAYFIIPLVLIKVVRKRKNLRFNSIFWMFAAFILLCGVTHLFNIITVWRPLYGFEGVVKLATGITSLATMVVLVRMVPRFLSIPLPQEMSAMNRALAQQIAINRKSEERLRLLNADLERRVAERTAALKRSNQDLTQFAYIASHDLQEPLRMVSNYTELLQRRYAAHLNDDAQTFMQYAIDGSRRMQQLISDLLAYAQVGREANHFRTVQLNDAVSRALASLQLAIDQEMARVCVGELPAMPGDEALLAQVFQNLINNALKYRSEAPPQIEIWATPDQIGGQWKFYVKDNGVGFDMQFKDRLFNMFQRLDTGQPGTGMGLALCKRIIQHHGGQIDVVSEPGVGTTFFFTLPATKS